MRVVIIIPTYNEAEHIEKLVSQILYYHPDFDILIVDDNSPDGTGRIADKLSINSEKIKVLHRTGKYGLGSAYLHGFKYILSLDNSYDRIIQMDADFSHSPEYLGVLLKATENNDISIGSRYISGGRIIKWSLFRRVVSYLANIYVRFLLGLKVKDCTSGFRCFRKEVLYEMRLEMIKSSGYLFQVEVLKRCLNRGYKCIEIPITFVERREGKAKFGFYDIWEAFWGVPKQFFL